MKKTGIFYGSTTGNTESIAKIVAKKLNVECFDIATTSLDDIQEYDNIILGTSTLGLGDLQDDWEASIDDLEGLDLSGKTIAIFGLGDAGAYPDTFVDAMGTLYEAVKDKGCTIVGETETESYEFDDSTAVVNGIFVGLPLDEDNESDLTDGRINKWLEQITPAFG